MSVKNKLVNTTILGLVMILFIGYVGYIRFNNSKNHVSLLDKIRKEPLILKENIVINSIKINSWTKSYSLTHFEKGTNGYMNLTVLINNKNYYRMDMRINDGLWTTVNIKNCNHYLICI